MGVPAGFRDEGLLCWPDGSLDRPGRACQLDHVGGRARRGDLTDEPATAGAGTPGAADASISNGGVRPLSNKSLESGLKDRLKSFLRIRSLGACTPVLRVRDHLDFHVEFETTQVPKHVGGVG